MSQRVLALLASARPDGDTSRLLNLVLSNVPHETVDLSALHLAPYSYGRSEIDATFLTLAERMIAADVIVLATPVYWYSMSGVAKTWLDRLTDLTTIRKELGRALAGTSLAVVSTGNDAVAPEGFDVPFRRTAEYLDLRYAGMHFQDARAVRRGACVGIRDDARRLVMIYLLRRQRGERKG